MPYPMTPSMTGARSALLCVLACLLILAGRASASERLYIFTENYPPYNETRTEIGRAHV